MCYSLLPHLLNYKWGNQKTNCIQKEENIERYAKNKRSQNKYLRLYSERKFKNLWSKVLSLAINFRKD